MEELNLTKDEEKLMKTLTRLLWFLKIHQNDIAYIRVDSTGQSLTQEGIQECKKILEDIRYLDEKTHLNFFEKMKKEHYIILNTKRIMELLNQMIPKESAKIAIERHWVDKIIAHIKKLEYYLGIFLYTLSVDKSTPLEIKEIANMMRAGKIVSHYPTFETRRLSVEETKEELRRVLKSILEYGILSNTELCERGIKPSYFGYKFPPVFPINAITEQGLEHFKAFEIIGRLHIKEDFKKIALKKIIENMKKDWLVHEEKDRWKGDESKFMKELNLLREKRYWEEAISETIKHFKRQKTQHENWHWHTIIDYRDKEENKRIETRNIDRFTEAYNNLKKFTVMYKKNPGPYNEEVINSIETICNILTEHNIFQNMPIVCFHYKSQFSGGGDEIIIQFLIRKPTLRLSQLLKKREGHYGEYMIFGRVHPKEIIGIIIGEKYWDWFKDIIPKGITIMTPDLRLLKSKYENVEKEIKIEKRE